MASSFFRICRNKLRVVRLREKIQEETEAEGAAMEWMDVRC